VAARAGRRMSVMRRRSIVSAALALALVTVSADTSWRLHAQPAESGGARIWIGQRLAIEQYLRTADVVTIETISVGVTAPRRVQTAPGGPIDGFTWKPIRPGRYRGFWESYKSEIAAYELDKLLALDMMPPAVERTVDGEIGAAVMWVSPTKSFKELGGVPRPPPAQRERWNRQIIRAKMIDNLIANIDPNLGNWLVDPEWSVILIDHSRAFTVTAAMTHAMTRIDTDLWARIQALDRNGLAAALGPWLSGGEIDALLRRRDAMTKIIAALVAKRGRAAVFV
jgi:hypothetical protein